MNIQVEEITTIQNALGAVFEPLETDALPAQRNVHVVLTEASGIRGNHYHRIGTETVTVYGRSLVRFRDGGEITDRTVVEGQALRFTFPPGVSHAFKNIGKTPSLLICFSSEPHNRFKPDRVPDMLIAD